MAICGLRWADRSQKLLQKMRTQVWAEDASSSLSSTTYQGGGQVQREDLPVSTEAQISYLIGGLSVPSASQSRLPVTSGSGLRPTLG